MQISDIKYLGVLEAAEDSYRKKDYGGVVRLIEPLGSALVQANLSLGQLLSGAYYRVGEWDKALSVTSVLAETTNRHGNVRARRLIINTEAAVRFERGEIREAELLFKQIASMAHASGDNLLLAWANQNLGIIADLRCERSIAIANFQRAIAAYVALDEMRAIAGAHNNLGNSYLQLGLLHAAFKNSEKARLLGKKLASQDEQSLFLSTYAEILIALRDNRMARSIALKSLNLAREIAHPGRSVGAARVLARTEAWCGRAKQAFRLLDDAKQLASGLHSSLLEAELFGTECEICLLSGDMIAAKRAAATGAQIWNTLGMVKRGLELERLVTPAN